MVAGKSPEWLPSGFTEKVKYKNGRRIKCYYNVSTGVTYNSKKSVLSSLTAENSLRELTETSNGDDNDPHSDSKVDAGLDETDDSTKWLPDGWTSEERPRHRSSHRGSIYKPQVYTDVSSGKKFYSREAVTKYLKTLDRAKTVSVQTKCDNIVEPMPHMSPHSLSMKSTGTIPEEKTKGNSFQTADEPSANCLSMIVTSGIPEEKNHSDSFITLDKVDDTSTQESPQCQTMTRKKKDTSFKPINVETYSADDLPPGWIKEIITSKSGKKTRKDPYYTDPVSGYVFRSKLDALRFVKTNDISTCAIRPKKRRLDDLNLVKNEYPSPIPAHEKSPEHRGQLFVGGESNGRLQYSDTKGPSISEAQVLKQTISNNNDTDGVKVISEENISCQNPLKNTISQNNPEPVYAVSKEEPTETAQAKPRNSRKRKVPNLPSRVSKRLSGSKPEMASDPVLNERLLRATAKISTGTEEANASQPSDNKTAIEIEPPKEIDVEPPPIEVKNPSSENSAMVLQEDQNKQESSLLFDFGDSWSDPLEFALKTLRGDIPIESLMGYFNENLSTPSSNNRIEDSFRPSSESDVPKFFQNKDAGASKQQGAVHPLPDNSLSLSGLKNTGLPDFSGFNAQPSSDIGKKDNQTKFN